MALSDVLKDLANFLGNAPVFRKEELDSFLETGAHPPLKPTESRKLWKFIKESTEDIRQGLFANKNVLADANFPYLLASRAFKEATLYRETALRFWLGLAPPKLFQVLTLPGQKQWNPRKHRSDLTFHPVELDSSVATSNIAASTLSRVLILGQSVQVTCPERTIVDTLNDPTSAPDLLEAWELLVDLVKVRGETIDWKLLLDYLRLVGSSVAFARVGLLLDLASEDQEIPESILEEILCSCPERPTRWHHDLPGKKAWDWNLYVPLKVLRKTWAIEPSTHLLERDIDEAPQDPSTRIIEDLLDEGSLGTPSPVWDLFDGEEHQPIDAAGQVRNTFTHADQDPEYTTQALPHDLDLDLSHLLEKRFGCDSFRPGQEEIVRALLAGKDVLGVLPTGSGKSLTYQMLTMLKGGTTLVVSPLIALMEDQVAEASSAPIQLRAALINGSMDRLERRKIKNRVESGDVDLLFMSPESLLNMQRFIAKNRDRIQLVAVDEAHCISAWGHDFRPAFHDLQHLRGLLGKKVPILALTATATPTVRRDIISYLRMDKPFLKVIPASRTNLRLASIQQDGSLDDKLPHLDEFISTRTERQGVIYCATKKGTEKVALHLVNHGIFAKHYHAGLTSEERRNIYQAFKDGRLKVVVATTAFGMGVNIPSVGFVVHMNMPPNIESYVQETGRAGRNGSMADCLLIHSPRDVGFHWQMAGRTHPDNQKRAIAGVALMKGLANQSSCRHRTIVKHFGDEEANDCRNRCDACCRRFGHGDVFALPE